MRLVIKQITKFVIIGLSAVLVDLIIYYSLTELFQFNTDISKACSFMVGTVYTYYLNKMWTWRYTEKSNRGMVITFVSIYLVSMLINIFVNKLGLTLIPSFEVSLNIQTVDNSTNFFSFKGQKFLAFFFATLASAVINFSGQKFLVFKKVKVDLKDETNIEVS